MILKAHIRHNRVARADSIDLRHFLPAAGTHIHQDILDCQGVVVFLSRCQKMNWFGCGDSPVLFPVPCPYNDRVGRQAGEMESSQHQNT